ncbi:MspA family porin [Tsukamurella soli]|uniref:MspA family porin n=1 Tax=Tsukamurella soli TaxID=644556 RepID=UPI00361D34CC
MPPAPDPSPVPGAVRSGPFADTSRALTTPDGYVIRAWLFGLHRRDTSPLGRALNSYESFLDAAGKAVITYADPKHKPTEPVSAATITIGVELGCAATPDSMIIGGNLSNTTEGSVTPGLSATTTGTGTGSGGSTGGQGGGSVSQSVTPSISGTGDDAFTEGGTLSGVIRPGTTREFPIARKSLTGTSGYVISRETRLAVDGCLGGAQVRAWATAAISTPAGDSSITTYSQVWFIDRDHPGPAPHLKPVTPPAAPGTSRR